MIKNAYMYAGHLISLYVCWDKKCIYVTAGFGPKRYATAGFGPKPTLKAATDLAAGYLEGVDPTSATVAAVAALKFLGTDGEAEIANIQRAFKVLTKGDDKIDASELGGVLKRMGHNFSQAQVAEMIKEADTDGSGSIEFKEFVAMIAPHLKASRSNGELRECFKAIDTDNSGYVTADELLIMLWGLGQRMDETQLQAAIKHADKSGDGKVDFGEFLGIFSS